MNAQELLQEAHECYRLSVEYQRRGAELFRLAQRQMYREYGIIQDNEAC